MHHIKIFTIFSVVLILFLNGCSSAPDIRQRVDQTIADIYWMEMTSTRQILETDDKKGVSSISFKDAFNLVAQRDMEMKRFHTSFKQSIVDINQSKSTVSPRFTAELSAEVPIGNDSYDANELVGVGVFLKYDILKAIFYKDSVFISQLNNNQHYHEIEKASKALYYRFLRLLNEIASMRQKKNLLYDAYKISNDAFTKIREANHLNGRYDEEKKAWENRKYDSEKRYQHHLNHLMLLEDKLSLMVGMKASNLVISDIKNILPETDIQDLLKEDVLKISKRAWHQRNDVEIAESDLLISEMGIITAKRKKLPRIRASLGIGNILLTNIDENAPVVPSIDISYPLFDMGDNKREIQKAENQRNLSKIKFISLLRSIFTDIRDKFTQTKLAYMDFEAKERIFHNKNNQYQVVEKLYQLKRTDHFDLYEAKLKQLTSNIDYLDAISHLRQVLIDFKEAQGESPDYE